MIDLTEYYTADKAVADTNAALEKKAENTFYSNLEKYSEEFDTVMDEIRIQAAKGLDYAWFTPINDYSEYTNGNSVPPEDARKFSVGYITIFNILPTFGYKVQKKGQNLYRSDAIPLVDEPICSIEYYSVSWEQ